MRVLLLDENNNNMNIIENLIIESFKDVTVFRYITAFSFVTGIYDELKGDADLLIIHISTDDDEKIKLAKDIQDYFPHIKLMFYSENVISAECIFQARPSFFFKMPIRGNIVCNALESVRKEVSYDNAGSLELVSKGRLIKLRYEAINYMESAGRKICIYSTNGNYETSSTMDDMMNRLPDYFYKCHRSYIVNLNKITSVSKLGIGILEKYYIPFSRELKEDLKMRLKNI